MFTYTDPYHQLSIPTNFSTAEKDDEGGENRVSLTQPKLFDNDNCTVPQVTKAMETLANLPTSTMKPPILGTVYSRQINLERDDQRSGDKQSFTQIELKDGWQQCRSQYIDANVKVVNLIRSVGSGASGDCCLAVSPCQKKSCVARFFPSSRDNTTLALATHEKNNWDRAYGVDDFETLVVQLGEDRGCLIMPYVDIAGISRDDCLRDGAAKLRGCLQRFSCKEVGWFLLHGDVKWRQLGVMEGCLILVDLGHVEETKDGERWSEWMESCMRVLKNSTGQQRKRQRQSA